MEAHTPYGSGSRMHPHVRRTESSARDRDARRLFKGTTPAIVRRAAENVWRHSLGGASSQDSIKSVKASKQDSTLTWW